MIDLPSDKRKLLKVALDLVEACSSSRGNRAAYCRQINAMVETGRQDGSRSLINMLHFHLDRLASHIFSPTDLRFTIDFENVYPKNILERGEVAAQILTRSWERNNIDMTFARGVFESAKYGAALLKQWVQMEGPEEAPVYYKRLVMPWQFGVYREDENELSKQSAMCETVYLTWPEAWRRIYHLPDADKLFNKIKAQSATSQSNDEPSSFFHQVLSTSTLNTGPQSTPQPGGIVQLNNDPNYAIVGPQVDVPMVKMHELWVQDEEDYTTIQLIEPDILIAPLYKKANLLIPGAMHSGLHPYTLIQMNETSGYFWGRTEIADLIEPQGLLSTWADDTRRLFSLQIDKILGFSGYDGLTEDVYDNMRGAGFFSGPQGSSVADLTPTFPPESLTMLQKLQDTINSLGGFQDVMQGKGESGVRAGVHANTLLKTGSAMHRDRSLLVERQCAAAADLHLSIMEAKDSRNYWTHGDKLEDVENTKFLLSDLPEDRRVSVDSHSSSPIFADDHQQLVAFGIKAGFIDGHTAIDMLPLPMKELLHARLRDKEAKQAKLIQEHPELLAKMAKGHK